MFGRIRSGNAQSILLVLGLVSYLLSFIEQLNHFQRYLPPKQKIRPIRQELHPITDKRTNYPVLDIISSGSVSRYDFLHDQLNTFGTHPAIRTFLALTEHNATDSQCHTNLTKTDIQEIVKFCHAGYTDQSEESKLIRQRKFLPNIDPGWLCAQKRPFDGVGIMAREYQTGKDLPDYLMLIDDDTYVNIPNTLRMLTQFHPSNTSYAITGCRLFGPKSLNFAYPVGGFGTIFTKSAIERLLQPIECENASTKDKFTQFARWRLNRNEMLERHFFRDGMSIADLMLSFASGLPFSSYKKWTNGLGFCFHSDIAIAYFVGYYHIAVPENVLNRRGSRISDRIRFKDVGFINFNNTRKNEQCEFLGEKCSSTSSICHHVTAQQMEQLWKTVDS